MGVVLVLSHPINERKSGQHSVDVITDKVEKLGAKKTGTYIVEADMYISQNLPSRKTQREVHILNSCEYPRSCFSILDNGKFIVSDPLQALIMAKLNPLYISRPNSRAEVQGNRYVLGDFIIKIGTCIIGPSNTFRGILIEVEYMPCLVSKDCAELLREFCTGFLHESLVNTGICALSAAATATTASSSSAGKNGPPAASSAAPSAAQNPSSDALFRPVDSMKQYLEHFNVYRNGMVQ